MGVIYNSDSDFKNIDKLSFNEILSKNCNILPIEVKWALPVGRCWQSPSMELAHLGLSPSTV